MARRGSVSFKSGFAALALTSLACSSSGSGNAPGGAGAGGASAGAAGAAPSAGAGGTNAAGSGGASAGGSAGASAGAAGAGAGAGGQGPISGYKTVTAFRTSRAAGAANGAEHCDPVTAPSMHTAGGAARTAIVVDASKPRQTITGFGAALTEVSASTIALLPADKQAEVYNAYFSATGSAYNLTRTHIGSCDFSLAAYTYDDTAGDSALTNFKIDHDQTYLIPALKQALKTNPSLKILASLWSAPAWMKSPNPTNEGMASSTTPSLYGGSMQPANYGVFAKYLSKYVQAYKAAGLDIWALTPTNEPLGVGGSRESMIWTADTMDTFLRTNLGPTFTSDAIASKLFVFDHNKDVPTSEMITWPTKMYGTTPNAQIAGTAVHWYNSTFNVFEASLDALHAIDPTKDILFDEGTADGFIFNKVDVKAAAWWQNDDWYWKKDNYDWGYDYADKAIHPAYQTAHRYARDVIVGLNHWYTGWIDWNAVLDKYGALDSTHGGAKAFGQPGISHIANGVPAGIMIDESTAAPVIYYTPIFYVMRQFSKFVEPGSKILTSTVTLAADVTKLDYDNTPTQDGQALFAVAAQNPDNSLAVVVFNETGKAIDYSVTVGDLTVDATAPAQSLETQVWKP